MKNVHKFYVKSKNALSVENGWSEMKTLFVLKFHQKNDICSENGNNAIFRNIVSEKGHEMLKTFSHAL